MFLLFPNAMADCRDVVLGSEEEEPAATSLTPGTDFLVREVHPVSLEILEIESPKALREWRKKSADDLDLLVCSSFALAQATTEKGSPWRGQLEPAEALALAGILWDIRDASVRLDAAQVGGQPVLDHVVNSAEAWVAALVGPLPLPGEGGRAWLTRQIDEVPTWEWGPERHAEMQLREARRLKEYGAMAFGGDTTEEAMARTTDAVAWTEQARRTSWSWRTRDEAVALGAEISRTGAAALRSNLVPASDAFEGAHADDVISVRGKIEKVATLEAQHWISVLRHPVRKPEDFARVRTIAGAIFVEMRVRQAEHNRAAREIGWESPGPLGPVRDAALALESLAKKLKNDPRFVADSDLRDLAHGVRLLRLISDAREKGLVAGHGPKAPWFAPRRVMEVGTTDLVDLAWLRTDQDPADKMLPIGAHTTQVIELLAGDGLAARFADEGADAELQALLARVTPLPDLEE